ncbi:unnamed protein product [Heligmosomoides polygyrus]|uniref:Autophagy-related protein n=1 Tax=Heligmosomoides polygyrus TaxID=6339 RepID=A0A183FF18_HELPZ|nr:unnamed protein product [Heligmosomoides polygyrus]
MEMSTGSSSHAMMGGICTDLLRIAVSRPRIYLERFFGTNGENGRLLMDRNEALKDDEIISRKSRPKGIPHPTVPFVVPICDPVHMITVEEIEDALRKTRPSKATVPDNRQLIYGSRSSGTLVSG